MVENRFVLSTDVKTYLRQIKPFFGFNGFGELTYYRTYSRAKPDGTKESWADTVIRVIEGVFSIRKEHYRRYGLRWRDSDYQEFAGKMAVSLFHMEWLPPGRGLWAMGTEFVYERGSAALYNCGACSTVDLAHAAEWAMDMLMCGVGIGFDTAWNGTAKAPDKTNKVEFVVPDSREGWVEATCRLIKAYTNGEPFPAFNYSKIRPEGAIIKGFGGTSSGYGPLAKLHQRIEQYMDSYIAGNTDKTRCVADVMNAIGCCVVAGNVRRSAMIALGAVKDSTFLDLKNYVKYPERQDIGWMSNNSVVLKDHEDFESLPTIADRIINNGEPGFINLLNVQKYGRFGREERDEAFLVNPCSEILLENFETCNLSEVFPTRCGHKNKFQEALVYATYYSSTVSLLPTHRQETNEVVMRNRRIGVSLSGVADLIQSVGASQVTRWLRDGYKIVRNTNKQLAQQAGIPESIRVTTVKPSGTISQLAGVSSGMHFPTFKHAMRRIRIGENQSIAKFLISQGMKCEQDVYSDNTLVFEFPVKSASSREAQSVTAWEQFSLLSMMQREWADNSVSCTVYFDPNKESQQVEHMLAQFAPVIKSASMLPHTDKGAYEQMPYEGISAEVYNKKVMELPDINWQKFIGEDAVAELYCTTDACLLKEETVKLTGAEPSFG